MTDVSDATPDRAVGEMSDEELVNAFELAVISSTISFAAHISERDNTRAALLRRLAATERPAETVTIPMNQAMGMLRTLQWAALKMPHLAPPGNAAHALAMSNAIDAARSAASDGQPNTNERPDWRVQGAQEIASYADVIRWSSEDIDDDDD